MKRVNFGPNLMLWRLWASRLAAAALVTVLLVAGTIAPGMGAAPALAADPTATPQVIVVPVTDVPPQPANEPTQQFPPAPLIPPPVPIGSALSAPVQVAPPAEEPQPGLFGVGSLAYASNGSMLALGTEFGLYIYDGQTWEPLGRVDTGGTVTDVSISHDGTLLATSSAGPDVQIWRTGEAGPVQTLQAPEGATVNQVAFSPAGTLLAVASSDGDIRLWDAADGRLARTLAGGGGAVESVAFSPNGQFLASGAEDGSINLWNVSTGVSAASVVAAPGSAARVAYSPDGAVVAFGSSSGPVGLWQVTTGHVNYPLTGHVGAVTDLTFSPAGGFLVSASLDGTIRLWQVGSGQALGVIRDTGGAVASLVFQPTTGRYLLSFAYDGSFRAWDLAGLRLLQACTDNAELVADVTVPSDPVVPPGVPVQKVWRVRNTGSCAWSARYQLVFVSGVPMGAASPQPLADVAPGGILDIVLNVVAPLPPGPYLGIWQMVNPDGQAFGPALSVVVQSGVPAPAVYITASATNINAGGSVTVQATAVGTVQAWLDGELMVNGFAQKTVWLCGDTTFTVVGLLPDGQYIGQSVLVTVNGSCGGNEADLEIKELTANTTQPNVGEVVHFSARIKNEGDADADDFDLEWRPSSGASYQVVASDLDLDSDEDMWVSWDYTYNAAGTYDTRARIEYEDDETHRSLTIIVGGVPPAPDVIITELSADDTTPAAGQTVRLHAVIRNQGAAQAVGYRLLWKPSANAPFELIAGNQNLNPGEARAFDFDYTWTQAGTYATQAVVNPGGYARSLSIDVSSPWPTPTPGSPTPTPTPGPPAPGNPNLVITDLSANPPSPHYGNPVQFTAVVWNQGDGPAQNFRLVWRPSPGDPFEVQADGLNLDPNTLQAISFFYTFPVTGTFETQAVVEFAAVQGQSMGKALLAPLSNSRTLVVVVGPLTSSANKLPIKGTVTPTPAYTGTVPATVVVSPQAPAVTSTVQPTPQPTPVEATPEPPSATAPAEPPAPPAPPETPPATGPAELPAPPTPPETPPAAESAEAPAPPSPPDTLPTTEPPAPPSSQDTDAAAEVAPAPPSPLPVQGSPVVQQPTVPANPVATGAPPLPPPPPSVPVQESPVATVPLPPPPPSVSVEASPVGAEVPPPPPPTAPVEVSPAATVPPPPPPVPLPPSPVATVPLPPPPSAPVQASPVATAPPPPPPPAPMQQGPLAPTVAATSGPILHTVVAVPPNPPAPPAPWPTAARQGSPSIAPTPRWAPPIVVQPRNPPPPPEPTPTATPYATTVTEETSRGGE